MLKTIKSFVSYLGCVAVAFAVMYCINGIIGMTMVIALICAFVLSVGSLFLSKKCVAAEIEIENDILIKGENIEIKVKLSNALPIPTSVIEIEGECSEYFEFADVGTYKTIVGGKSTYCVNICAKAVHGGLGQIGIKNIRLRDYLGIFSVKAVSDKKFEIPIYFNIREIDPPSNFFVSIENNNEEDSEESNFSDLGFSGFPGYEHREYIPGDPIKRINWKLSSKRDVYMVRLDERPKKAGFFFFLDDPDENNDENKLSIRDNIIECMLSVLSVVTENGRETIVSLCRDKIWEYYEICGLDDILELQKEISKILPCDPTNAIPPEILKSGCVPVCFTSATGEKSVSKIISLMEDTFVVSSSKADIKCYVKNHALISDDLDFEII